MSDNELTIVSSAPRRRKMPSRTRVTPRKGTKTRLKRKQANKRPKTKSLSKLKKEADKYFSLLIRQRYADKDGMVKCFTSGIVKHWKSMHCGHYLTRGILALRWNENNARPQTPAENIWKHGNPIEFRINLIKEIGEEEVVFLEAQRKKLFKPTREFYEILIANLKQKLTTLTQ